MICRDYLPYRSAREYVDRGMAKWTGFFISEHSHALSKNEFPKGESSKYEFSKGESSKYEFSKGESSKYKFSKGESSGYEFSKSAHL